MKWYQSGFGTRILHFYMIGQLHDPVITRYDWIAHLVRDSYFLALYDGHHAAYIPYPDINWPTLKEAQEEIERIYHGG